MDTSGGGLINAIAYVGVIGVLLRAALPRLGPPRRWALPPDPAAIGLWLAVAIGSVIGLVWPTFADALSRESQRIRDGQWWRLLTSVLVQDGGVAGTCANLVYLAIGAVVAVAVWGRLQAIAIFVVGAVVFNVIATYWWGVDGAGNSAATMFLVTATVGLLAVRACNLRTVLAAAAELAIGVVLLCLDDGHGVAVVGGLLAGLAVAGVTAAATHPVP